MDKPWTTTAERRALVTGATGTVGRALLAELGGHAVVTTRDPATRTLPGAARVVAWDGRSPLDPTALEQVDTVFHLLGEPVAEGRWSDEKKARIARSRIDSTRALVDAFAAAKQRPRVLVCASAVGYYGARGDELLTEASGPGEGFLPDVCVGWEEEAARARALGLRVVSLRIGIVLSTQGGALAKMLPIFRLGLAGRLGDGKQFMPWIHQDDVVGLLRFAAAREDLDGPLLAVAPDLVTNAGFTRALASSVRRPAFLAAPAFALRAALGEAAAMLLASQRCVPELALEKGFRFEHPSLAAALADLLPAPRAARETAAAS
jgi:uncharacterized protein (TIGR01777 family)